MARTQTLTDGAQSFPSAQHARPDAGKSNTQCLQKGIRAKVATFAAMGKKVILRLLLVVLVSSLMPHGRAVAQLAYGLRGGVGFPTLRSTFVDRTYRTANIVGFHAGASIAYFFATAPGLYVESGAQLALLGGASLNVNWYNPSASDYNTRLRLYALQIPLRLGFTTPLGALSVYVSGGFLPSVALWGQLERIERGAKRSSNFKIGDDLKRFDVALSFHTGVGFGRLPLFFGIYVDYGLIGIFTASDEGHIGNFGLSLAYMFGQPSAFRSEKSSSVRLKNANAPQ